MEEFKGQWLIIHGVFTEITASSYGEIIFKGSPKELLEFKEEGG